MAITVRRLEPADLAEAYRLSALAFGEQGSLPAGPPPAAAEPPPLRPGWLWYGAYDTVSGRLVGTALDRTHLQWWGGREVSAADVASVAVLPEARGAGIARAMLTAVLEGARDRGAAVSALYPTVAAPYARAGWATCGELRTLDLPTGMLPRLGATAGLTVRPADPGGADQPAVLELYGAVARSRNGLLTRRTPPHAPDTAWPAGVDGITLVHDGARLVGYAAYARGTGYRQDALLDVHDLHALTPAAAETLLGVLAGWRSVTPTVRLRPLDFDAFTTLVPWEAGLRWDARPWMHRPVDVASAVSTRGWPEGREGRARFALRDELAPWNSGSWELGVGGGEARLKRTTADPGVTLDVAGFALLYCGAATAAQLREAGLVTGSQEAAAALDLLRPAGRAQLLDYF